MTNLQAIKYFKQLKKLQREHDKMVAAIDRLWEKRNKIFLKLVKAKRTTEIYKGKSLNVLVLPGRDQVSAVWTHRRAYTIKSERTNKWSVRICNFTLSRPAPDEVIGGRWKARKEALKAARDWVAFRKKSKAGE